MRDPSEQLRRRMALTVLALAVVLLGCAVLASLLVDAMDVSRQRVAYGAAEDLAAARGLATAALERAAGSRGYLLSGDEEFLATLRSTEQAFTTHMGALRTRQPKGTTADNLDAIDGSWRRLLEASKQAFLTRRTDMNGSIALWQAQVRPVRALLDQQIHAFVAAQALQFDTIRRESERTASRGKLALACLALAMLGALGLLLNQLTRTSRELIGRAKADQEQTMFQLLDQVPVGIFVLDRTGKPYYANQWSHRLLGRPADARVDLSELMTAYAAFEAGTDRPYPLDRAPLARALKGERSEVSDMEIRRAGEVIALHVHGGPVQGPDGFVQYAVAAFQDVRELQRAATRDPLTGLGNRSMVVQSFARERLLSERLDGALAVAMIDIDHFKQVNDRHGHPTGDAVLKRVATVIVDALRRTDVVGRWGGEEFLVLLPHTPLAGACSALQTALNAVRREVFEGAEHTTFGVTFSAGVIVARPGESFESAVARADALLYRAKGRGRNCIADEFVDESDASGVVL